MKRTSRQLDYFAIEVVSTATAVVSTATAELSTFVESVAVASVEAGLPQATIPNVIAIAIAPILALLTNVLKRLAL